MNYAHDDRHRARTELLGCGDLACVSVHDLTTCDALACYVTPEQAREMAAWLIAWAQARREDKMRIDTEMIATQTGCHVEDWDDVAVMFTGQEVIALDWQRTADWSPCYDVTRVPDAAEARIHNAQSLIDNAATDDVPRATALKVYEQHGTWVGPDLTVAISLREPLTDGQVDRLDDALDVLALEHGIDARTEVWAIGPTVEQLGAVADIVMGVG